ncbi:P-loop containing nucleoside triphosphate hydrolase protein [Blyttiomyces helicus]|uniref:P-loop containing nucleoside triphosphate hydrolase protein n=1 Tax=Blyttiomyces helicus TaxID=388810 RepID=A0A4P9W621_9FUNG|nr:P-loop containing nucleoside triphosphate hydrolase protein [Blyttiomyces helicus]|eukprot:RKO85556.1 P-loop containing nucleoside triphosphate hydrolase protein [Blyttiomyces helicus]
MNAVERVEHYAYQTEVEAPPIIPDNRPPPGWPTSGAIKIEELQMRYAPDLPLVLDGISLEIKDKEKIGVVGRTGSGKSSLMQALFRMVEPASGKITISGLDASALGLEDLRSGLAIIPQDPVLFSGTVRTNLDPFGKYQDADLWDALARAGLKEKVTDMEDGLDGKIQEGGENLSVGQRQLLCLSRAMLKKPRIIVMDEATASVDYETDAVIQRSLREDFKDATILTIAHRLNTIIDYDRVLVLDGGRIAELGTPAELLALEDGKFRAMVEQTGATNSDMLKNIADHA